MGGSRETYSEDEREEKEESDQRDTEKPVDTPSGRMRFSLGTVRTESKNDIGTARRFGIEPRRMEMAQWMDLKGRDRHN